MAGKYPYTKEDVLGVDHLSAKQKQDIADDWNNNHLEAEAVRYSDCRQAEYPSVGDQLDMMMKDMRDGTNTHQTACETVKTKYPKPS